ncbi:MAG: hypothetical protein CFE44_19555 [Burkholderiales bacterium PBB4]|nr:MAG: hypothetical protein CFE44_19555 [Burkholderiales bacterium PBB4]
MIRWLNTKKSVDCGKDLAKIAIEQIPKDLETRESKRASKINYAKEKMRTRILELKEEDVLNFYKTATLLNTFKWELKDAGYSQEVTDSLTTWILITTRS